MSRKIVTSKSTVRDRSMNNYSKWSLIPEPVFIDILKDLSAKTVLNVGECCSRWNDISKDNYLWKRIFQRDFRADKKIEIKPGKLFVLCFHLVLLLAQNQLEICLVLNHNCVIRQKHVKCSCVANPLTTSKILKTIQK